VIRNEETGFLRIESGITDNAHSGTRKKNNAAAEGALQPVVFLGIEDEGQGDKDWNSDSEMEQADGPEQRTADDVPGALHI
jgi:hypothetical protein